MCLRMSYGFQEEWSEQFFLGINIVALTLCTMAQACLPYNLIVNYILAKTNLRLKYVLADRS